MTGKAGLLDGILRAIDAPVLAVSGGVDSMTLAHLLHRAHPRARMVHAVSPAVPAQATARVRAHAAREGWSLTEIDAGEFEDGRYRANPANRCYFCKTNLYGEIARRFAGQILSGTNTDDLADDRPGLAAAAEHGVRHPFVEAVVSKAGLRAIARGLGLGDLAELPAAPCLSSRIETGIRVDPGDLALVATIEDRLRAELGHADIRCRITLRGVRVELGGAGPGDIPAAARAEIESAAIGAGKAFLGFAPYRRGSAFLRPETARA